MWIAPMAALALSQPMPTQIRVKIFPHLYDYLPQRQDVDPSTVELKSSSNCEVDQGNPNGPASTGVVTQQLDSLDMTLTHSKMDSPLWISCDGDIQVVRSGDVPSFSYSGPIYIHDSTTGPELIQVKAINDYLQGVLPSEMAADWAKEALKAQAVAARTYAEFHIAYAKILGARSDFYDVDDTVFYQAYTGTSDEKPTADQAIADTGFEVMTYGDQVIQAYFSASAGGYTEEADHVWPVNAPYCQAKPESFSDADPWKAKLALADINQKLFAEHLISSSNPVTDVVVKSTNRWASGRASKVTLVLRDGVTSDLDALNFRKIFDLKSTLFTVEHVDTDIVLSGRGFGHGVGMSQDGAEVLAKKMGWDYRKILNYYYSNIQIQ